MVSPLRTPGAHLAASSLPSSPRPQGTVLLLSSVWSTYVSVTVESPSEARKTQSLPSGRGEEARLSHDCDPGSAVSALERQCYGAHPQNGRSQQGAQTGALGQRWPCGWGHGESRSLLWLKVGRPVGRLRLEVRPRRSPNAISGSLHSSPGGHTRSTGQAVRRLFQNASSRGACRENWGSFPS